MGAIGGNATIELSFPTFVAEGDKQAALKPLEEAAEAFAAWQRLAAAEGLARVTDVADACVDECREDLAEEVYDCMQACANLAARCRLNMRRAKRAVDARNRERGRL